MKIWKNRNLDEWKFGKMKTWEMEIRKNGNFEKWKCGKIGNLEKWKFKKLCTIKGNRKNKEIWINKNRE